MASCFRGQSFVDRRDTRPMSSRPRSGSRLSLRANRRSSVPRRTCGQRSLRVTVQGRSCRVRANGRLGICGTPACRLPGRRLQLELAPRRHPGRAVMHVQARAELQALARYWFAVDSLPADRGWQAYHFPRRLAAPWKLRDWKLRDWKLPERMAAAVRWQRRGRMAPWSWMPVERPLTFVIDPERSALSPHQSKKLTRSAWIAPSPRHPSIPYVTQYRAPRL